MRKWDKENPEKRREYARKSRAKNIESIRLKAREWAKKDRLLNPDKWSAKDRKHYQENQESERKRSREYYFANREENLARMKQWRQRNLEKRRIYRNRYNKTYRQTEKYKFEWALRMRIVTSIKNQTKGLNRKCGKTTALLGCSIKDFRMYLESRFEPGMSWNNFGKTWHMDHIIPCAIFDLSKAQHQKRCFHFSNIRPCFASENLKKGSKLLTSQFNLL